MHVTLLRRSTALAVAFVVAASTSAFAEERPPETAGAAKEDPPETAAASEEGPPETAAAFTEEDRPETTATWTMSVGFSPTLVALKGIGLEVDVKAPRHLRLAASAFTLAIPELFQNDNADEGWTIRDTGASAGAQLYLRADARGFYIGALVESQHHHVERAGRSRDALEIGVGAEIGYRWMPWKGLYITPRLLAIVPLYTSTELAIAGETLDEPPVRPVPLLFAGWEL